MLEVNADKIERVKVKIDSLEVFSEMAAAILEANGLDRRVYVTKDREIAYDVLQSSKSTSWEETFIVNTSYHQANLVMSLELIAAQLREHNI